MAKDKIITVKVERFNPEVGSDPYQTYKVPLVKGMSVLNVLNYIYENLDRSLSYYFSCRIGKCQGCYARINGKVQLICSTVAGGDLEIGPWPKYQVIKDLVVDLEKRKV